MGKQGRKTENADTLETEWTHGKKTSRHRSLQNVSSCLWTDPGIEIAALYKAELKPIRGSEKTAAAAAALIFVGHHQVFTKKTKVKHVLVQMVRYFCKDCFLKLLNS